MDRRGFLEAVSLASVTGVVASTTARTGEGYGTINVPGDAPTVQDGIDATDEGDLVLVADGTYPASVQIETAGITLRGRDRNAVVLDGEFGPGNGIHVTADGVAVENLTVRHFQNNAVYWQGVEGFRGSYLTATNNGYYGIYAARSRDGRFEYSHASGHPDAGFYLGRNHPYEAVITDVVAEYNGLGYSGTSAGGDLTIRDSVWRHNMAGIVPNTLGTYDDPQRATHIVGNEVYDNGNENAPIVQYAYGMFGTGVLLWGGSDNVVEDNVVDDHPTFGIAATHSIEEPSGNLIRDNDVGASERADLALGTPAGEGNQFEGNQFETSMPEDIEVDPSEGSERVSEIYERQREAAEADDYPSGDWRDQPVPGDLPTMPDPEAPPRPASKSATWDGN